MTDAFRRTAEKMKAHGLSETAIAQFEHLYDVWQNEDGTTWIREEDIEPVQDIPNFAQIYETINHDKAVDAFAKTAFLKLNGGLGTSMGLDCAKSLLPVRRHKAKQMRFIDIILGQVETARNRLGVELPLTFMNSFRTSADTMKVLNRDKRFHQEDVPMEIIQHVEPKIDLSTGSRCHSPPIPILNGAHPGTATCIRPYGNRVCSTFSKATDLNTCSSRTPTIWVHARHALWPSISRIPALRS